jgi:hypothetical protein
MSGVRPDIDIIFAPFAFQHHRFLPTTTFMLAGLAHHGSPEAEA